MAYMKDSAGDRLDTAELVTKSRTNVGTRILAGRMGTRNVAAGTTDQLTVETATEFSAVRIIIGNAAKNISDRIIGVAASVGGDASDLNNSGGTWVTGTKDGIGAFATDMAPAVNHTAYTVTDWIPLSSTPRTDGGTKPLLYVRARTGGNSTMSVAGDGTDDFTNWATRTDGHRWAWRTQVVDAITDPTAFTSTTNISQSFIVGVQYLAKGRVITVGAVGDSITEGRGTRLGEGFMLPACDTLAADIDIPVEYANFGWSGQSSSTFFSRGHWLLESPVRPDVLVVPNGSPNDYSIGTTPITDTGVTAAAKGLAALVAASREHRVALLGWTWLPTNTAVHDYGATDAKRTAYNAATLANDSIDVADTATAVSGVTTGGQVQMAAGTTSDDIHPNDTGNAALATAIRPKLRQVVRSIRPGRSHNPTRRSDLPKRTITFTSGGTIHGGGLWTWAGTSAGTVTLAEVAPSNIPQQTADFTVIHARPTAKKLTVNRSTADVFLVNGTTATTFDLYPGETAVMWHEGTGWVVSVIPALAARKRVTTSGAATFTVAQEGEVYVGTATTGTPTWTLPALADNAGRHLIIKNRGSVALAVQRTGTDQLYDTAAQTSVSVAAGGTLRLVNDGTYWLVV